MTNPIEIHDNKDGTYTVLYFGSEAGFINKVKSYQTRLRQFRAVSVHGTIQYSYSLKTAKDATIAAYF